MMKSKTLAMSREFLTDLGDQKVESEITSDKMELRRTKLAKNVHYAVAGMKNKTGQDQKQNHGRVKLTEQSQKESDEKPNKGDDFISEASTDQEDGTSPRFINPFKFDPKQMKQPLDPAEVDKFLTPKIDMVMSKITMQEIKFNEKIKIS